MKLVNEKVRSEKLYSVGFSKELDSYVMSIVVPWIAWYNRYYRITKEKYKGLGEKEYGLAYSSMLGILNYIEKAD